MTANGLSSSETPCWKMTDRGFRYTGVAPFLNGISSVALEAGSPDRAKISMTGLGENLILPRPPLTRLGSQGGAAVMSAAAGPVAAAPGADTTRVPRKRSVTWSVTVTPRTRVDAV